MVDVYREDPPNIKPQPKKESDVRVSIALRLKPISNEKDLIVFPTHPTQLVLVNPMASKENKKPYTSFKFDHFFTAEESSHIVFSRAVHPMIIDAFKGTNQTIFLAGMPVSGKSHTFTGSPQDPGIVPHASRILFQHLQERNQRKGQGFQIIMSYF
jgi:hypothetical protein